MEKWRFGLSLFAALAPFAMRAADIYVSHLGDGSGTPFYNGAPAGAYVTNDLQAAVDLAAAGDTVWVEDGFVCDSGAFFKGPRDGRYRVYAPRRITLRSRSGRYEDGAVIRGAFHSAAQPCGPDAIKGLYLQPGSTLVGFRIEGAATCDATNTGEWSSNYSGATATQGGGLTTGTGSIVSNCLFSGCHAYYRGGGASAAGAVFTDCVFSGNIGASNGGGAYGASTFVRCLFTDNTAPCGAGAYNVALATNCVFTGNAATSYGGAISGYNCDSLILDCVITNNSAAANGGGVGLQVGKIAVMGGTLVADNYAKEYGGGIGGNTTLAFGNLTVRDSIISNNYAVGNGGGIHHANVSNCVVIANFSRNNGGGIADAGTIYDSEIVGNVTSNNGWNVGIGGGIFNAQLVQHCLIAGNQALNYHTQVWQTTRIGGGGGFAGEAGNAAVDCVVTGNFACVNGGGLCGAIAGTDNYVSDNSAGYYGGGIWGGTHTNATVLRNVATYGGGISGVAGATNCVMRANYCTMSGGGANESTLYRCLVEGNVTTNNTPGWNNRSSYGGGVYGGTAVDCLIRNNVSYSTSHSSPPAGIGGGAAAATLIRCVVTNNVASSYGGGVSGGSARNCLVAGNLSGDRGGGIYSGSHFNTLVTDNTCSNANGAAIGYQTSVYNCTVTGNHCNGANITYGVNCVFFDNGNSEGSFSWATNCCVKGLAAITSKGPGNSSADPKLGTEGDLLFVPLSGSPCRERGVVLGWMTDLSDARSKAYNGRPRFFETAPDIGACESRLDPTIFQLH